MFEEDSRGSRAAGRSGFQKSQGDWTCANPGCANVNFARRNACNRCQTPRPDDDIQNASKNEESSSADFRGPPGLFKPGDWTCTVCGNVNWERRQECNICKNAKPGMPGADERRDGVAGGFNERQERVASAKAEIGEDGYDDFGMRKKKLNASKTQREVAALARLQQSYSAIYQPEDAPRASILADESISSINIEENPRDASPDKKERKRSRKAVRGIKIEAPVDVLIVMETEGDDPILQLPLESVAPTIICTRSKTGDNKALKPSAIRNRRQRVTNRIPDEILSDQRLTKAMETLPWNYNFEIRKTVWRIRQAQANCVALQFPEGLLMYSCVISDIIESFTSAHTVILGDVTYGACCVDDLTAIALGADFMVHYGHSCLVPVDVTTLKTLYVFVDITIDIDHLVDCVKMTLGADVKLALMGTIQFGNAINSASERLMSIYQKVVVPQIRPLSPGEVLGCTSPLLDQDVDAMVFIADGRFHLESAMIANPSISAYRYDPYAKVLSLESYDYKQMTQVRSDAIEKCRYSKRFGIILGTLGRQGNPEILNRLTTLLESCGKEYFVLLLSEIFPDKLAIFEDVDAWIQVACPRLSIDWGYAFAKPLLSPYEAEVCLGQAEWKDNVYPMDYYAKNSNSWTNYYTPMQKT
ncbi:hypothetical protein ABG067_007353 [Albugo candida]